VQFSTKYGAKKRGKSFRGGEINYSGCNSQILFLLISFLFFFLFNLSLVSFVRLRKETRKKREICEMFSFQHAAHTAFNVRPDKRDLLLIYI
jgi:hypothetical protein